MATDVFDELDPNTMSGTFVGIPVLNGPAFSAGTRESGIDFLNLARIFPGDPQGSISMRIAHAFKSYLLPQADLYLDIHSGGGNYAMHPFSGYGVVPSEEITKRQLAAATAFGLDVIWASRLLPGRTLTSAAELGVPAIYVELRGEGRCIPRDRALTIQGIRNVMAFMGIIEGSYPTEVRIYAETVGEHDSHLQADHPSPTSGLFVPDVELWQYVEAGQRLGVIRHPDGSVIAEVPVSRTGRVLFLRTFPRVFSGDCLAYVLALPEAAV
jgi:predicted deacylase